MRVVVLGTGGAARAAVAALRDARSVTVLSRGASPGTREWARRVEIDRLDRYGKYEADLLINATPVGMSPNVDATPVEGPIRAPYVFDMIYNPERTRLLRDAEAQGLRTMSGRTMFMAQAARQFEIWTGRPASPGLFSGAA
jgi:shikimate 5-dehydrogenase